MGQNQEYGVSLRDGIRIDLSDGSTVVADAASPPEQSEAVAVLSHAHGDHLFDSDPGPVICSTATADLARVRRDTVVGRATDDRIELHDAGHVVGSRAAVVTDPDGTRYCYTGDVSTRDRLYLSGFEPPDADVLVVEATYGTPEYVFPPQDEIESETVDWLEETNDQPVLLFGYALGRAQKLQVLADRAGRDVFVSDAIASLSMAMEPHISTDLPGEEYDDLDDIGPGDAVILPTGVSGRSWVENLCDRRDALSVGFSGWAVDDSFRYRGGYDETFVLSDHCDFRELCELVAAVDPDRVYTTHGFAAELAGHLTSEGYDARALVEDQHTLDDSR